MEKSSEKPKMKFFAPRDWHILHFLLTLVIGIMAGITLTIVIIDREANFQTMNETPLWLYQLQRVNSLEKTLNLAPELQADGSYKHVPRPADYDEISPSASEDYKETTKN